jgi:hypothetical protein
MNGLFGTPAPYVIITVVTVIVAVIVAVIVLAIRYEKKRAEALRGFAESNGFTFSQKAGSPGEVGLPEVELFGRGHSKRLTNVMAGEVEGSGVRVLDYRYTTGSGKNSSTARQTVVAVATGGAVLPDFTLARENFFHKIGQAFGYQDIDFEGFPEFSKKFLLRGADEEAIRGVFSARLIDAYIDGEANNVEVRGGWLLIYRHGKRLKPELIQGRIESAFTLLFELTGA